MSLLNNVVLVTDLLTTKKFHVLNFAAKYCSTIWHAYPLSSFDTPCTIVTTSIQGRSLLEKSMIKSYSISQHRLSAPRTFSRAFYLVLESCSHIGQMPVEKESNFGQEWRVYLISFCTLISFLWFLYLHTC